MKINRKRKIVSFTIDELILAEFDISTKANIQNKSRVIEALISQYLSNEKI